MSKFPPSRSQVPVDERSVLATVPGLPWWGAILTLLAFTAVGALAAGTFAGANAGVQAIAVGGVVAVLAVRNRALFTAMVQPPLVIAASVPIYRWFSLPSPRSTSQILTDVLFPLISLFPWMFWITVVVLLIGVGRLVLYRGLTAAARSSQRTASTSERATTKRTADRKPAESTGLPLGERLRAAFARMKPAASGTQAAALVGAGSAAADSGERHQRRSSRPSRTRSARATREDRAVREDRATRQDRAVREDAVRPRIVEKPLPDAAAPAVGRPRGRVSRDVIRDEGAPATQQHRVVRPDYPPARRPAARRAPDEQPMDPPRMGRPRPRPRPLTDDRGLPADRDAVRGRVPRRDPREAPRDVPRDVLRPPRPRDPEIDPREVPPGPRAAVPRPDSRDYRREARGLDRARSGDPAPRPRAERDRPRIPRDDFVSLPRISGSRAAQPDLPSLPRDPERAARGAKDAPAAPGRYEHYRAPRYRPLSEEQAVETNFRDDFADPKGDGKRPAPEGGPRPIRRHRYKD